MRMQARKRSEGVSLQYRWVKPAAMMAVCPSGALVRVLGVPLMSQLPAKAPVKAEEDGSGDKSSATHVGDPSGFPGSWFEPDRCPGYCKHLGTEPTDRSLCCLFLCFSLSLCHFALQINKSILKNNLTIITCTYLEEVREGHMTWCLCLAGGS